MEAGPDYQTYENKSLNNNTYEFIIETKPGKAQDVSRFGKWQMKFIIDNIDNKNELTISCGMTTIADNLKPAFAVSATKFLSTCQTVIAKYKQCVSVKIETHRNTTFEIVVTCGDNENGFKDHKVPCEHPVWLHSPFDQSINLLLFLQKQNLATAIYLFGLGTLLLLANFTMRNIK